MKTLKFKVAEYDLEGNLLRFDDLRDQIMACDMTEEETSRVMEFGNTVEHKCTFDISKLTNEKTLPKYANVFFDLFLEDFNGDLIDVPVRIQNVQNRNG